MSENAVLVLFAVRGGKNRKHWLNLLVSDIVEGDSLSLLRNSRGTFLRFTESVRFGRDLARNRIRRRLHRRIAINRHGSGILQGLAVGLERP